MYLKENRLVYGIRGHIDNYSNLNSFFTLAFYNIQITLEHPVYAMFCDMFGSLFTNIISNCKIMKYIGSVY